MTEKTQEPELFSEGWLFASLLEMVVEHCGTGEKGTVKSFGWGANARAMRLLAEAGYLDMAGSRRDDEIEGKVSMSGRELLAQARRAAGSTGTERSDDKP